MMEEVGECKCITLILKNLHYTDAYIHFYDRKDFTRYVPFLPHISSLSLSHKCNILIIEGNGNLEESSIRFYKKFSTVWMR